MQTRDVFIKTTFQDEADASFLLCRKYRRDISGITRKPTAEDAIGAADFLTI